MSMAKNLVSILGASGALRRYSRQADWLFLTSQKLELQNAESTSRKSGGRRKTPRPLLRSLGMLEN
jgi:hypothetical protein